MGAIEGEPIGLVNINKVVHDSKDQFNPRDRELIDGFERRAFIQ